MANIDRAEDGKPLNKVKATDWEQVDGINGIVQATCYGDRMEENQYLRYYF